MGEVIYFFYRKPGSKVVRRLKKEMPSLLETAEHSTREITSNDAEIVYSVILLLDHFRPEGKESIFSIIKKDSVLKNIFQNDQEKFLHAFLAINEYWRIPHLKSNIHASTLFSTFEKITDIYSYIIKNTMIIKNKWYHLVWEPPRINKDEMYTKDGTGQMVFKCFPNKQTIELSVNDFSVYQKYPSAEKTLKMYDKLVELDVDQTLEFIDLTFLDSEDDF